MAPLAQVTLCDLGNRLRMNNTVEAGGELKHGTEIVASEDRLMSALLGTLPGVSSAGE
ncbi:malate:quinone oxidoreductase [Salipiger pacificus]|nr:malate:quinone oxidoreductase [Alloyangia pacifica]